MDVHGCPWRVGNVSTKMRGVLRANRGWRAKAVMTISEKGKYFLFERSPGISGGCEGFLIWEIVPVAPVRSIWRNFEVNNEWVRFVRRSVAV
jgi:hypothetical protein